MPFVNMQLIEGVFSPVEKGVLSAMTVQADPNDALLIAQPPPMGLLRLLPCSTCDSRLQTARERKSFAAQQFGVC